MKYFLCLFFSVCVASESPSAFNKISMDILSGGSAGLLTALVIQPPVNMKIQRQLGGKFSWKNAYAGLGANMASVVPATTTQIVFKEFVSPHVDNNQYVAAAIAGGMSAFPTVISEGTNTLQRDGASIRNAVALLRARGIFCGLSATFIRDTFFTLALLAMYPSTYKMIEEKSGNWFFSSVGSAVLVACPTAFLTHPFDTIKSHQQAQTGTNVQSMLEAGEAICKKNGLAGFYKGLGFRTLMMILAFPTINGMDRFVRSSIVKE